MEIGIAKNEVCRVRGGEERTIMEAWENLGYAIVEDCCAEWIEQTRTMRKLEIKKAWKGLTRGQEILLSHARARRKMCEEWLRTDWCYDLCGYEGDELIENMKERLRDYGLR